MALEKVNGLALCAIPMRLHLYAEQVDVPATIVRSVSPLLQRVRRCFYAMSNVGCGRAEAFRVLGVYQYRGAYVFGVYRPDGEYIGD
jgi:hypothetical protein